MWHTSISSAFIIGLLLKSANVTASSRTFSPSTDSRSLSPNSESSLIGAPGNRRLLCVNTSRMISPRNLGAGGRDSIASDEERGRFKPWLWEAFAAAEPVAEVDGDHVPSAKNSCEKWVGAALASQSRTWRGGRPLLSVGLHAIAFDLCLHHQRIANWVDGDCPTGPICQARRIVRARYGRV